MDLNKTIKLTLEFSDMEDLASFIQRTTGGGSKNMEPLEVDRPLSVKVAKKAEPMPAASPFDITSITTPVATLDGGDDDNDENGEPFAKIPRMAPPAGGKIKGIDVKKALEDYKEKFGKPEAQRILKYFGATSIRALDKSKYADFLAMVSASLSSVPDLAQTMGSTGNVPFPEEPATDDDDEDDLAAPGTVNVEMLKSALTSHKAKWGMEATMKVVHSIGYEKPSDVPASHFRALFVALSNYKPAEESNSVDLSMFD